MVYFMLFLSLLALQGCSPYGKVDLVQRPTPGVNLQLSSNDAILSLSSEQKNLTNFFPIRFRVQFSQAIDPRFFTVESIIQKGTAKDVKWELTSTDNISWALLATSASSDGTVSPGIKANAIPGLTTSDSDTSVTYDATKPTLSFVSSDPSKTGSSLTPSVVVNVSEISQVTLYHDQGCSLAASAPTKIPVFDSQAITMTRQVNTNGATTIFGIAIDEAKNAGPCMNLFTYTHGTGAQSASPKSVAAQKDTAIETIPVITFTSITPASPHWTLSPTLTISLSQDATVTLYSDSSCTSAISASTGLVAGSGQLIAPNNLRAAQKTQIYAKAVNYSNVSSLCTSLSSYTNLLKYTDPNPNLDNAFGMHVVQLSNGNVVVTSYAATVSGISTAGAVYLFGRNGNLISTLSGSHSSDRVGSGGVTVLSNDNYVVISENWNVRLGAVTWCSGSTGCSGAVSSANSLIGSRIDDLLNVEIIALSNGNYVVKSPKWDMGAVANVGAVSFGSGLSGLTGAISPTNSLVGSTANDHVGSGGIIALNNGNFVIISPSWDAGAVADVGAVTWVSGNSGQSGAVAVENSLVGSTLNDQVGSAGVTALSNGHYVVHSPNWDQGIVADVGAVTWMTGHNAVAAVVDGSNSLIGTSANDQVGSGGSTALSNGNYVVKSPNWDAGAVADAGAVSWGSGTTGLNGVVSSLNSLVGSTANDKVGSQGVTALSNGHYVVISPLWDNPGSAVANVGAVTWGSGLLGIKGVISSGNSLIGSSTNDSAGIDGVTALSNGNYVVSSSDWNDAIASVARVGAVTWGSGTTGISGNIGTENSLIGSTINDYVGYPGVTALSNGNYVVASEYWDEPLGSVSNAGAVTWGSGTAGMIGVVGGNNSLIGSSANDKVGDGSVISLSNGNYVVVNYDWDNPVGPLSDVGAVTWGSGLSGISGAINASNSLIGSTSGDSVGYAEVKALSNGNYVVSTRYWDQPSGSINVGAVTWGSGLTGTTGIVSSSNSLVGAERTLALGLFSLTHQNYVIWSRPDGLPGLLILAPGGESVAGIMQ